MRGPRNRWRMTQVTHLEQHPNLNEILGLLAQLPHVTDGQLPQLARGWRNTAYIADARAKALSPDSPLVLEVLACFEAVVSLFAEDLAGEADYVTVPVNETTTALKAIRDAIAAAYARPVLARGQYAALMRPWRDVFPEQRLDEPDLGSAAPQIKALLQTMPRLATRCHDAPSQQVYDDLVRAAVTMDATLRQTARDEAWRAAVLTSRRRVWAMVRRSGIEAMSRSCRSCAEPGDRMAEDLVLELCLDAACGLLVVDALDDTLADVLVLPLRDLVPLPRRAPDDVA